VQPRLEIGVRSEILRSCLALSGDKISSASACIHQPQRSITRHAEEFGILIIEIAESQA
jgi:imidazole glycerol phosphate synthase subunit HisF